MSMLPAVLFVAGTGMTLVSQYQETQAQVAAARYNAAVARMQAEQYARAGAFAQEEYRRAGEYREKQLRETGRLEEYRLRRRKKALLGKQRALYAKAGVLIEGSPLEVMADTASQFEFDIALSRYRTERDIALSRYETRKAIALSKYETETAVRRYGYEAKYKNWLAGQYKRMGYAKMGQTLLTAGYTGYEKFRTPKTTKLPYVPGKGYGPV